MEVVLMYISLMNPWNELVCLCAFLGGWCEFVWALLLLLLSLVVVLLLLAAITMNVIKLSIVKCDNVYTVNPFSTSHMSYIDTNTKYV